MDFWGRVSPDRGNSKCGGSVTQASLEWLTTKEVHVAKTWLVGWSGVGNDFEAVGKGQLMEGVRRPRREPGFYSEYNEKVLELFETMCNTCLLYSE